MNSNYSSIILYVLVISSLCDFLLCKPDTGVLFVIRAMDQGYNAYNYNAYKAVRHIQQLSVMKCPLWYMNRWNTASMNITMKKKNVKRIKQIEKNPGKKAHFL